MFQSLCFIDCLLSIFFLPFAIPHVSFAIPLEEKYKEIGIIVKPPCFIDPDILLNSFFVTNNFHLNFDIFL